MLFTDLLDRVRRAARITLVLGTLATLVSSSSFAASSVTLAWDPSAGTNIAGYKIYYGAASRTYTSTITVGNANTAIVSNLISGATYYFAATAYDTSGLESDFSGEVGYTNVVLVPPTIALTSPANNAAFTAPATINLAASVTANGHSITRVQFYNGATLLGEAITSPYVFPWNSVAAGSYSLTARVVYDAGSTMASTAANVTVTSQPLPAIALTSPADNAAFTAPATINLAASVTANGHSITRVQFYNGPALLGEDTTSPYTFPWSSVAAGSYSLTARVVYDAGSTTASTAADVTVTNQLAPTIALTSPANNAAFTAPATINLAASVTANGHSITRVQFYNGPALLGEDTTSPYTFPWSSVAAGSYSLTARVVYDSASTVASIAANVTVTNLPLPIITLTSPANNAVFTAPANITLVANVTTHGHSVTKVQFYNGAALLAEDTSAPYAFTWSSVIAGSYSLTTRLVYDTGATLDSTPAVSVLVASPRPEVPPTISAIPDQSTPKNTPTPAIPFTISDADTAVSSLTLSASSANPALVPTNNIVFGGSDSNRTVTVTPANGHTGYADITLTVSDGALSNNTTFRLTVSASSFTLVKQGKGRFSPDLSTQTVTPGQLYTITAIPEEGQDFAGWSGGISSTSPRLTFMMTSNLVLKADFVPSTSGSVVGAAGSTYNGLFYQDDAVLLTSAGSFTLSVNARGKYSGRIQLGAKRYSFSGLLDSQKGGATNVISRHDGAALTLDFHIGGGSPGDQISGRLTDGTWASTLSGDRAVFGKANPAPLAGNYTMVIPGYDGSASLPAGNGFGTVKVDASGKVKFAGTLADGTKVSQSTALSKSGYWPLHLPLYSGNGCLMSWLAFASQTNSDLSGTLSWIKQPGAKTKYYLGGFTFQCDAFGSAYVRTDPVLNLPMASLMFCGGGLTADITNSITIGPGSKVVTPGKELKLSFSPSIGTFKGTLSDPSTGKPMPFSGAVFQKLNAAYGVLLGTGDKTSAVELVP